MLEEFVDWASMGFEPVVDKVFSFDQTKEAFRYLEAQLHFGKVVITID